MRELRQETALELTGSMALAHQLIAAGLVDEYRLFVYPVVLGRGTRLFEDADRRRRAAAGHCRSFRSGVAS